MPPMNYPEADQVGSVKIRDVDCFLAPLQSTPRSNLRMNMSFDQTSVRFGVSPPSNPIQNDTR